MADLCERADGTRAALGRADKATAAIRRTRRKVQCSSPNPVGIRRVVKGSSSGPQRVVGRRVSEAKRITVMLCDCAVCGGAAEGARGQSTFEKVRTIATARRMATRAAAAPSVQVAEATAPSRMAATAAVALYFLCLLFYEFCRYGPTILTRSEVQAQAVAVAVSSD